MNLKNKIAFLLASSFIVFLFAGPGLNPAARAQEPERYRVMFYNTENLFDTRDDTLINDDEFLPEAEKHWTTERYYKKLNNIYRVVISCGEWDPPAIAGLCEVENRKVLDDLVTQTPLERFGYRVIHFDSPDSRGIDVAMIYRGDLFDPDTAFPVPVFFPDDPDAKTRDILYVKGKLGQGEIHVFVNHWPSRYGGYEVTRPKRNRAAGVLRTAIDTILAADGSAAILVMGDFNDGPYDESMLEYLRAEPDTAGSAKSGLLNLTAGYGKKTGTLKYRENWDVFDQLIISNSLLDSDSPLHVTGEGARIHNPDFLLENDAAYLGVKPFRTYAGMKYLGGYSDHLPVYLDLKSR